MIAVHKPILDVCCGSKMFYFDKDNENVCFCDIRKVDNEEIWESKDGKQKRFVTVIPDVICDFRELPFENDSFYHVVFDPPHMTTLGENSWMAKKYGKLNDDWEDTIKLGFNECMRVLKTNGTLIFKWNETDIPVSDILRVIGQEPIYGHKSGKRSGTHWMCFVKV